jgi:glutamate/tyrosine decarboxylase-like PLP-dependent enzyme
MTLQLLGTDAIKSRLRLHISLAKKVEKLVSDEPRLEMAYPRTLNILTFMIASSLDPEGYLTKQLSKEINTSGRVYMTHAVVNERSLIRWVTGQTYTQEQHIDDAWKLIQSLLNTILT